MKISIYIAVFTAIYFLPIQSFGANLHIQTCEKGFIGYEYSPKLEKQCSKLWKIWTCQILSNKR